MVLADTSVWIDHLRKGDEHLSALLNANQVLVHPFVVGEIALGSLKNRASLLQLLTQLAHATLATDEEVLAHISNAPLFGLGIGYIDAHLLASVRITPDALQALHDLKAAGLHVIAITGRPVGWSEPFAAQWPEDAIVAENGSVALFQPNFLSKIGHQPLEDLRGVLSKSYQLDGDTRQRNYTRMQQVLARIEREVLGAQRSTDSAGRETDIAIDHSEFTQLPPEKIAQVVSIMESEGLQATVSSIHINGWISAHNKLQGAHWIVRELFQRDLSQEMHRWAYVGDSTNDQLMFEAFESSIGVANVARFLAELKHLPRYISKSERGTGFSEVAACLCASVR